MVKEVREVLKFIETTSVVEIMVMCVCMCVTFSPTNYIHPLSPSKSHVREMRPQFHLGRRLLEMQILGPKIPYDSGRQKGKNDHR